MAGYKIYVYLDLTHFLCIESLQNMLFQKYLISKLVVTATACPNQEQQGRTIKSYINGQAMTMPILQILQLHRNHSNRIRYMQ